MAEKVTKTMKVSANGVLNIDGDRITIDVEDVGTFSLKNLLKQFDGSNVKFSCSYDEEQESPDVDQETGEVLD